MIGFKGQPRTKPRKKSWIWSDWKRGTLDLHYAETREDKVSYQPLAVALCLKFFPNSGTFLKSSSLPRKASKSTMDPLSALVVATSVVGFLDFGAKLVSRYFEIKSSVKGQPAKVAELDKAARELFDIASKAHDNVSALVSNYPKHTESLSRLLNECNAANTKLRVSLDKLTVVPSEKWTRKGASLVVAIRSVWTEDEIDEWTHRVERIRNQMMMNVLMCVW